MGGSGGGTLEAAWAGDWAQSLQAALPSRLPAPQAAGVRLRSLWTAAADPARRTLAEPPANLKAVSAALKKPLPAEPAAATPASQPQRDTGPNPRAHAARDGTNPFAPMSDAEYEAAVAAWQEAGAPAEQAPLNPEQRTGGRSFLRHAQLRAAGRARGETPTQIAASAQGCGCCS